MQDECRPGPPAQEADKAKTSSQSLTDKLQNAGNAVLNFVSQGSDFLQDHPLLILAPALMSGNEGPAEEGLEEVGTAVADAGQKASMQADEVLTRFGTQAESTLEKLSTDAAAAEHSSKVGNLHGVSAMANAVKAGGTALRSEVEKVFTVVNTGRNPDHRTIVLPKPVTDSVVKAFNSLFWH